MNQEHLALVEFAMRRVIEARPRPSSVTQTQAAEMLGVSRPTVAKLVRSGKLKLNGLGQIPVAQIDKLLAA